MSVCVCVSVSVGDTLNLNFFPCIFSHCNWSHSKNSLSLKLQCESRKTMWSWFSFLFFTAHSSSVIQTIIYINIFCLLIWCERIVPRSICSIKMPIYHIYNAIIAHSHSYTAYDSFMVSTVLYVLCRVDRFDQFLARIVRISHTMMPNCMGIFFKVNLKIVKISLIFAHRFHYLLKWMREPENISLSIA